MSDEANVAVKAHQVGNPIRKFILLIYAGCANELGRGADPKIDFVASVAECDKRTVQRHVQELVRMGFLRPGNSLSNSHIPVDRRPRVYDVAMDEKTVMEWREQFLDKELNKEFDKDSCRHGGTRPRSSSEGLRYRGDSVPPRKTLGLGYRGDSVPPREESDENPSKQTKRGGTVSPRKSFKRLTTKKTPNAGADAPGGDMMFDQENGEPPRPAELSRMIAEQWWNSLRIKPMQSFIHIKKVIEIALINGHEKEFIIRCLNWCAEKGKPISGATMQMARTHLSQQSQTVTYRNGVWDDASVRQWENFSTHTLERS